MPVRRRRSTALAAAVATAAALGATALATVGTTTASAAEMPLKGYELTWGIKQSYRTYVGMFGGFTTADGAAQAAGNGAFTFVDGAGTYDTTGHTVELAFKGSLVSASEAHGFEVTLTDVRFDSKAGEITADVKKVDTSQGAPETTEGEDVPLATVAVTRDMKEMATTLTAEAGEFLGSPGYAGAEGDPLTVVEKTPPTTPPASPSPTGEPESPAPSPSATETTPTAPPKTDTPAPDPTPSKTNGTGPSPSPSATAPQAPAEGEIADGTLGWGVKQSFRSYVTGPVAKGKITVSGGAVQAAGNGAFTFKDATGTYDTDAGKLTAAFRGAVNFKGHETNGTYGLDLTLSNIEATLDGGAGKLTADVNSLGTRTKGVVLADLEAKSADLTARNDVITVDGVAATLTEAGAKAFGDFYTAGTALDAVDLSVALSEDARLPSGGGTGGSGGSGTTGGTGGGTGSTAGGTGTTVGGTGSTTGGSTTGGSTIGGGSLASTGSDIPGPALAGAAGIAVALGAGTVFAARRRRTQA
ncbi:HtaA domain-containing protein [Streptomyces sp. NPDC057381]|uniref:HtaA domain-containing protein n=1 Tax=unclassified Streptomyces TaxID=2593676 RepID=UPI00362C9769